LNSAEGPESLVINLGGTPDDHISHIVERPRQVWVRQTAEGTNQAIEIEEEDNQKTLRFQSPTV
jgi:hypothetical protein